ncbi:nucleoside deaminase [Pseudonocardiaceae bacterium YIM PH 21723]|nr:nucleoside deaminase [Pseudonocardiaceae bacterium YIM PH 21723]
MGGRQVPRRGHPDLGGRQQRGRDAARDPARRRLAPDSPNARWLARIRRQARGNHRRQAAARVGTAHPAAAHRRADREPQTRRRHPGTDRRRRGTAPGGRRAGGPAGHLHRRPGGDPAPGDRVARAGRTPGWPGRKGESVNEEHLRRAIALAADAHASGNPPFGSLLVGPDGDVLVEDHNTTITDRDITAHPELKLARWAAAELTPETAAGTTMYTSCQPCEMCSGALARSGIGKVVYALSAEQFGELDTPPKRPAVPLDGPHLFEEARIPIDTYFGAAG